MSGWGICGWKAWRHLGWDEGMAAPRVGCCCCCLATPVATSWLLWINCCCCCLSLLLPLFLCCRVDKKTNWQRVLQAVKVEG